MLRIFQDFCLCWLFLKAILFTSSSISTRPELVLLRYYVCSAPIATSFLSDARKSLDLLLPGLFLFVPRRLALLEEFLTGNYLEKVEQSAK